MTCDKNHTYRILETSMGFLIQEKVKGFFGTNLWKSLGYGQYNSMFFKKYYPSLKAAKKALSKMNLNPKVVYCE